MESKKYYIFQRHIIWYILPLWVKLTTKICIRETDAKSLWNNQCGQMIQHRKLYIQIFGNMIEGMVGKSGKGSAAGARVLQLLFSFQWTFFSFLWSMWRNVNGCTVYISIFHFLDFFGDANKQVKKVFKFFWLKKKNVLEKAFVFVTGTIRVCVSHIKCTGE